MPETKGNHSHMIAVHGCVTCIYFYKHSLNASHLLLVIVAFPLVDVFIFINIV